MNGQQCLATGLDIYDVAGGIRASLIELQNEVRQGATAAPAANGGEK